MPDATLKYQMLAYRRAVYDWLITQLDNALPDNYMSDNPEIFCDTLPYEERTVPSSVVLDVLAELRRVEDGLKTEMDKFRLVEVSS